MLSINRNYIDQITYDEIGSNDCENRGCLDEGICRCFSISKIEINQININEISKSIFKQIFDTDSKEYLRNSKLHQLLYGCLQKDIDLYCIDRILRINKLYDPENWEASWESRYYGDEAQSISILPEIFKNITNDIEEVIYTDILKEKIEIVLFKEYGFILDEIKNKKYKICNIKCDDVIFGQKTYFKKLELNKNEFNYYSDKNFDQKIIGVCLFENGKWRVIDGYHRILKSQNNTINVISLF